MPKKKPTHGQPEANEALDGFDIRINEFGEIISNLEIDRINEFLNQSVEDKKLTEKNKDHQSKEQEDAEKEE